MESQLSHGEVASFWYGMPLARTRLPPPIYTMSATSEAGAVAAMAEDRKRAKYLCLEPTYSFTPVAINLQGPLAQQHWNF